MNICWVGKSDFYEVERISPNGAQFVMPLCEDAVFDAATLETDARRLSLDAAIKCSIRFEQRLALADTNMNPNWESAPYVPGGVWKLPYSTFGKGVVKIPEFLFHYGGFDISSVYPKERLRCVVEEHIDGDQYEVDGLVLDGEFYFLPVVHQQWVGSRVWDYEVVAHQQTEMKLMDAAARAVKAVGLDDCPFCVEIRMHRDARRPYIVEVNARFGEDFGLVEAWKRDPIVWAESMTEISLATK